MPPGTPYHSFIPPYPIRVDEFTVPNGEEIPVPALHLLTHTHSDHVIGLNAKSFDGTIVCSIDAKEMLLRHETYKARFMVEQEIQVEKMKTYSHLKADVWVASAEAVHCVEKRDLLRALPLHTPTVFELSNNQTVTITLLDANHCPGAVMFLIEGSKGAVLHTGDFRAEPLFISSLLRNPYVQRYTAPRNGIGSSSSLGAPTETLAAIYLDTASMMTFYDVPSKEDATNDLVKLMAQYPPDTRFYINAWTWGYEDILKAIAHAFSSKIHVDRYKHSIYSNLSDPFLRNILTRDHNSTRFHACERFDRCDIVPVGDQSVIYINPMKISTENWNKYYAGEKMNIQAGKLSSCLLCPLARHSPLPELQRFVEIFKPRRLIPNFLEPKLHRLDWACMPSMFGSRMHPEAGADAIREELEKAGGVGSLEELDEDEIIIIPERENIESAAAVGDGEGAGTGGTEKSEAEQLAVRWADDPELESTTHNVLRKMRAYLAPGLLLYAEHQTKNVRERKHGVSGAKGPSRNASWRALGAAPVPAYNELSQEETQSDAGETQKALTMELFFGGPTEAYNSQVSSPIAEKSQKQALEPVVGRTKSMRREVLDGLAANSPSTPPRKDLVDKKVPSLQVAEQPLADSSDVVVSSPTLNTMAVKTKMAHSKPPLAEAATQKPDLPIAASCNEASVPMIDLRSIRSSSRKSYRSSRVSASAGQTTMDSKTTTRPSSSNLTTTPVSVPQKKTFLDPVELLHKPTRLENQGLEGWEKVMRIEKAKRCERPAGASRKGKEKAVERYLAMEHVEATMSVSATAHECGERTSPHSSSKLSKPLPRPPSSPPPRPFSPILPSSLTRPRSPRSPEPRKKLAQKPSGQEVAVKLAQTMSKLMKEGQMSKEEVFAAGGRIKRDKKRQIDEIIDVDELARKRACLPPQTTSDITSSRAFLTEGSVDRVYSINQNTSKPTCKEGELHMDFQRSHRLKDQIVKVVKAGGHPTLPRYSLTNT